MEITGAKGAAPMPAPALAPISPQQAAANRDVLQAVKALNTAATFGDQNEITFQVDRASRLPVIRIVDRNTREVVTQIPAEYILRLAETLGLPVK
jgi:uncharacterized FlaG/YvyC family protein